MKNKKQITKREHWEHESARKFWEMIDEAREQGRKEGRNESRNIMIDYPVPKYVITNYKSLLETRKT